MTEQQFKEQVAKEGFQTAHAKFIGYADEPKTGIGKKGAWRKVKTNWHVEGKENQNKFTIWTPLTSNQTKYKSDKELELFKTYRIVWVEENQEYNGNKWVDKKIVIIQNTDEKKPETQESQTVVNKGGVEVIAQDIITEIESLKHFDEFIKSYTDVVPEDRRTVNHILGTYLKTYYPEYFKNLIEKCKSVSGV